MAVWGTGPLKNHAAQDLILALEPLAGGERVRAIEAVFAAYAATDRRWREAAPAALQPDEDDGSEASMRAVGAAWLVAAALGRVVRPDQPAMLAGEPAAGLAGLATAARAALTTMLADAALVAAWHQHADDWTGEIRRLHAALAPDAATVPAGTGEYEDLDDPETLARHNRGHRARMILVLAAIVAGVYLFR